MKARAECSVQQRDVAVVEEIEGLGDKIEMSRTEGNHPEETEVKVDV